MSYRDVRANLERHYQQALQDAQARREALFGTGEEDDIAAADAAIDEARAQLQQVQRENNQRMTYSEK